MAGVHLHAMPGAFTANEAAASKRRAIGQRLIILPLHLHLVHARPVGESTRGSGVPPNRYGDGVVLENARKEERLL